MLSQTDKVQGLSGKLIIIYKRVVSTCVPQNVNILHSTVDVSNFTSGFFTDLTTYSTNISYGVSR